VGKGGGSLHVNAEKKTQMCKRSQVRSRTEVLVLPSRLLVGSKKLERRKGSKNRDQGESAALSQGREKRKLLSSPLLDAPPPSAWEKLAYESPGPLDAETTKVVAHTRPRQRKKRGGVAHRRHKRRR